jgi:hypothetical protein
VGALGVSSEEGERMRSTDMGEDMVVRSKRRWCPQGSPTAHLCGPGPPLFSSSWPQHAHFGCTFNFYFLQALPVILAVTDNSLGRIIVIVAIRSLMALAVHPSITIFFSLPT